MRLLHCRSDDTKGNISVAPEDYTESHTPPYAILSHRWGKDVDEVSFRDITGGSASSKKGFSKILECAKQALSDGFHYIWIDTCCIDKTSSSELSEAINSMYAWYRKARVCYAYLDDVSSDANPYSSVASSSSFRSSRWFTRGWTLQELIAPSCVVFFAKDWTEIGSKTSLAHVIQDITKIDAKALVRTENHRFCVATRMSWASKRETARVEDRAYSLMGIFGVNMPTIYGEGTRAFTRLQLEILKMSNDHSIFAWQHLSWSRSGSYGMLADSPDDFVHASHFDVMRHDEFVRTFNIPNPKADYAMTNAGLHIQLPLKKIDASSNEEIFIAYLACVYGKQRMPSWIYLKRPKIQPDKLPSTRQVLWPSKPATPILSGTGTYVRTNVSNRTTSYATEPITLSTISVEDIFIAEHDNSLFDTLEQLPQQKEISYKFTIFLVGGSDFEITGHAPKGLWSIDREAIMRLKSSDGSYGTIVFKNSKTGEAFSAILGVHNWRVWSDISFAKEKESAKTIHERYDFQKGDCGQVRLKGLDWVKKHSTDPDRTIVMTSRQTTIVGNTAAYAVKIKVG